MVDRPFAERALAYAQLLRLSNVLTAVADVWMGIVVAAHASAGVGIGALLTLASVGLYLGGMVLNDVLDADRDAQERPTRPIPSGRIPRRHATPLACALVGLGVLCSVAAAWLLSSAAPAVVGVLLALAVYAYDGPFKQTPLGPFVMGACRGLNVLLGMSIAGFPDSLGATAPGLPITHGSIALAMLVYVMSVTEFARTESRVSHRARLVGGALGATAAIGALAVMPVVSPSLPLVVPGAAWALMWALVAIMVLRRMVAAIIQPAPKRVQSAVGDAIMCIIVIDAALAWGYAGTFWGLAILALLPPTMLLARFIPQT